MHTTKSHRVSRTVYLIYMGRLRPVVQATVCLLVTRTHARTHAAAAVAAAAPSPSPPSSLSRPPQKPAVAVTAPACAPTCELPGCHRHDRRGMCGGGGERMGAVAVAATEIAVAMKTA